MNNKEWEQPKLIVLVRGKADEAVLRHCKSTNAPIGGPVEGYHRCHIEAPNDASCAACLAQANT